MGEGKTDWAIHTDLIQQLGHIALMKGTGVLMTGSSALTTYSLSKTIEVLNWAI